MIRRKRIAKEKAKVEIVVDGKIVERYSGFVTKSLYEDILNEYSHNSCVEFYEDGRCVAQGWGQKS